MIFVVYLHTCIPNDLLMTENRYRNYIRGMCCHLRKIFVKQNCNWVAPLSTYCQGKSNPFTLKTEKAATDLCRTIFISLKLFKYFTVVSKIIFKTMAVYILSRHAVLRNSHDSLNGDFLSNFPSLIEMVWHQVAISSGKQTETISKTYGE